MDEWMDGCAVDNLIAIPTFQPSLADLVDWSPEAAKEKDRLLENVSKADVFACFCAYVLSYLCASMCIDIFE
jgi:hypothetical protein